MTFAKVTDMTKKKRSVSGRKGAGHPSPKRRALPAGEWPTPKAHGERTGNPNSVPAGGRAALALAPPKRIIEAPACGPLLLVSRGRFYFQDLVKGKPRVFRLTRDGGRLTAEMLPKTGRPANAAPVITGSASAEEVRFFSDSGDRGMEEFFPATWSWAPTDFPVALFAHQGYVYVARSEDDIRIYADRAPDPQDLRRDVTKAMAEEA